jgi:hypothetical protein
MDSGWVISQDTPMIFELRTNYSLMAECPPMTFTLILAIIRFSLLYLNLLDDTVARTENRR